MTATAVACPICSLTRVFPVFIVADIFKIFQATLPLENEITILFACAGDV